MAIMTAISIALGWLVAGRVLRPLRAMTATTRQISERNLNERLALSGPRDELKDLADTIDGVLARLESHVAEQQRFAANASHELRTPLSLTQTLLDVARQDPNHGERRTCRPPPRGQHASDRPHRSIAPAQPRRPTVLHPGTRRPIPDGRRSHRNAPPFAEERGVTIEVSGDTTPTLGSRALLLQLTTNLVHNAIVHNLPQQGAVWVTTSGHPEAAALTVVNTGEKLTPQLVSTLGEPFLRGSERIRTDHAGVGLGLAIVKRITQAHDGTLILAGRAAGGLCVTVQLPAAPPHTGR